MIGSRDAVLASVRRALGRPTTAAEVEADPPRPGIVPAGARRDPIAGFLEGAARVGTTVARVASAAEVPGAVAAYLAERNLPAAVKLAPDARLRTLPWAKQSMLATEEGRAQDADAVGVAHAFAGVAETGTLVLVSGPAGPTTLNFLPDTHIVVVRAADVVGAYDDAWVRLRRLGRAMPRLVTWITGPSRTGDIEQEILVGIHGPRRLHVVLVDAGKT